MRWVISAFLFLGPHAAILVWQLLNSALFTEGFLNTFILTAGKLFLPAISLIYALVFPNGIFRLGWLWIGISVLVDLSLYGVNAYSWRWRIK